MFVRALLFVCVTVFAALLAGPAAAERRVALVIGNGTYTKVPKLANATNDARAIMALLEAAGFDKVVRADNLGAAQMRRALRDFSDEVRGADIAVVFYAGHGMELNGTNYLIPVDAVLERDIDVADETISLDRINQVLEPAKRLRLVILDACRDNPFVRSIRRTLAGRAIGRGLAPIEVATTDTLIAYAAKAGLTAADGDGANSPYTTAMVKHLTTPGLDVRLALGRVRDEVLRTTGRRQEPFVYGSLGGAEVPLIAASRQPLVPPPSVAGRATASAAAEAWDRIKETSDAVVLDAFIVRFGDTFFGDLAKSRLAKVRREQHQEEDRKLAEAEAAKLRKEADARRKADDDARAKTAAALEAKRKADEIERQRVAAIEQQKLEAARKASVEKAPVKENSAEKKVMTLDVTKCDKKFHNASSCSISRNSCKKNGTVRACELAYRECMGTGRWVYRRPDGSCIDWGLRDRN